MKVFGVVYKITNLLSGKLYVGQTRRALRARFNAHCTDSRKDTSIAKAIRKYGRENFKAEQLAEAFSSDELNSLESFYIDKLNTLSPNGYNLNMGGDKTHIISKETLERLSKSHMGIPNKHKGVPLTLEHRYSASKGKIIGVNLKTKECYLFNFAAEVKSMGFNPKSVGDVLRKERKQLKGWAFFYEKEYISQVNQSGRSDIKESEHTQRLVSEPMKIEYNETMSSLIPTSYRREYSLEEIVSALELYKTPKKAAKMLNTSVSSIKTRISASKKKGIKVNLNL